MKRSELFFDAILLPIDFAMLLLAAAAAYWIRVSPAIQEIRPAVFEFDLPFLSYMQLSVIVSLLIVAIFAFHRLYTMQVTRRWFEEITRIFSGISIGALLVLVFIFFSAEPFQSRFIVLAAYGLALLFVTVGRTFVRRVQRGLLARGFGVHRVLLVGMNQYARQLRNLFSQVPQLGYRVVGVPDVVRWDVLESIYQKSGVDEVIQADPTLPEEDQLVLLDFCDKYKIDYKYVPNLFETYAVNVRYRQLAGVPMMELQRTPLDGWGRVVKRGLDLFGAIVGVTLLSLLLLLTALLIKLDSRGPVLYKQKRVGKNKQPFDIYKFRSMHLEYCTGEEYGGKMAAKFEERLRRETNERNEGPLFKMRRDPRVTRVGRFIRKWRIDELPQFINVLLGEMSLLGPRPHLLSEVQRYDKHQQKLFTIKPGMSGMAQVNGNAGLTFTQEAALDIGYIENWSLWLDIILLIKTFLLLLRDRNAV